MDAAAIAKAVQSEIERQQADVVYNDLSVEELEGVVQHLTARLELCKEALAAKQGEKKPEAKKVAQKSEGTWPDLPWTDRTPRRPRARRTLPPCVLRCGLPAPPRAPAAECPNPKTNPHPHPNPSPSPHPRPNPSRSQDRQAGRAEDPRLHCVSVQG